MIRILGDSDALVISNQTFYKVYHNEQHMSLGEAENRKEQTFGYLIATPFGPAYVDTSHCEELVDL